MLTPRGYRLEKGSLAPKQLDALRRELTMTPVSQMVVGASGGASSFPIYQECRSAFYVPKYFGLQTYGVPAGTSTVDPGEARAFSFTGALRAEQLAPCDAFLRAARDPARMGGIVSLSCGQGKTVIALNLIAALGTKTLIVVHKDFLLMQWRERIEQFLPGARVGTIKGKVVDVADRDIVIASVQSLSMKTYPDDVFRGIGFLVIDECHRVGTEVFSRALLRNTFRYSLGLSATVTRKDGMTKVFVSFLGDVVYRGKRRVDAVQVVQRRYFSEDPAYCTEETIASIGKPNMSRMVNNICAFPARSALIADILAQVLAWQPGRKALVLSDRKEQLAALRELLAQRGIDAGFYYGGLKPRQLAESEAKQVLLATFAYAAEGMDCRGLDTLLLASPKSDIEQSCGRILRERAEDRAHVPLIIDILDAFSLFERQGGKRRAYYKKNGYAVVRELEDVLAAGAEAGGSDDEEEGVQETYAFRG